jgi:hypothetical protein
MIILNVQAVQVSLGRRHIVITFTKIKQCTFHDQLGESLSRYRQPPGDSSSRSRCGIYVGVVNIKYGEAKQWSDT